MFHPTFIPNQWRSDDDRHLLVGRVLFFLTCSLLLIMPWTEHFWTFDRFLRGGHDLELGLFALVSFLCLVLVLSQHFQREVALRLASCRSQPTFQKHIRFIIPVSLDTAARIPIPACSLTIHLQI